MFQQSTNPLRLVMMVNVRVTGITESSGTSYLDDTNSRVTSLFSSTLSDGESYYTFHRIPVSSFTLSSIDKYSWLLT